VKKQKKLNPKFWCILQSCFVLQILVLMHPDYKSG